MSAGLLAAVGFESKTVTSSSAVSLSPPSGAARAVVQVSGGNVRWRDDGTDPTVSSGMLLFDSRDMLYEGPLEAVRFVAAGTSATLNVSYYK